MNLKEMIDSANARSGKGQNLTLYIIVGLLVVTALGVGLYVFSYNRSLVLNNQFESAYKMLTEFQGLNQVSKNDMKDKVLFELDQVIAKGGNSAPVKKAWFYKGYVYYSCGEYETAEKILEDFIKKSGKLYLTEKAYYYLSYTKSALNKTDEAIDVLLKFETKYKKSYYIPLVLFRLADLYEQKGEKEQAIASLKKIVDNYDESSQKDKAQKRLTLLENDITL